MFLSNRLKSYLTGWTEGYAKMGLKDKIRFYNIAQGSIEECRYYLILSRDLGFGENSSLTEDLNNVGRMLNGYISGTKRKFKD